MKKKLQKEISELAAELSREGTEFNVRKVKQAIRLIFEKLTVLEYLEGQLEGGDQSFDSKSFREQNWFVEPEPVPQPEHEDELVEPVMEKIKDIVAQMPEESDQVDELLKEVLPEKKYVKNDLEEFASNYQETPVFERKEPETAKAVKPPTAIKPETLPKDSVEVDRPKSLNEVVKSGLNIGLNDRHAFIKHLFNDRTDDYTRVLSQINSMRSFEEAATFIKGKVKPDYNYWLNKDKYAERFMALVEKSFN
ncbi:MAG: hypothetical protein KJO05_07790 [Bacteroidia bacterium]|nr:hypothetical protein [Bacteroidia bacterium]NNF31442.1 hypothetical protein [Flavobacteriaceae bacterium]MBT8275517.1 hypothetical protein [Bacteroidia bacterium]NNJ82083.1 hypothetical protein [Flavobacteriaceae bacterium]NNK54021.1 hypothetical protein [Flavobacteriaceae bacterium]